MFEESVSHVQIKGQAAYIYIFIINLHSPCFLTRQKVFPQTIIYLLCRLLSCRIYRLHLIREVRQTPRHSSQCPVRMTLNHLIVKLQSIPVLRNCHYSKVHSHLVQSTRLGPSMRSIELRQIKVQTAIDR